MKYIRTKEGIWLNKNPNGKKEVYTARYSPADIIKQANNIEELCDECVYKLTKDKYPWLTRVSAVKDFKLLKQFGGTIGTNVVYEFIYLAIWTDKGLIYVAKMNKKGCLELL